MELTGKCKESFKKWYRNPLGTDEPRWTDWNGFDLYNFGNFQNLDPSMQYGVYVDFFDSVGVEINIGSYSKIMKGYGYGVLLNKQEWVPFGHKTTRPEARTAAIKKAVEIFNNRQ